MPLGAPVPSLPPIAPTDAEAREMLKALVARKTGPLSAEWVVEQVLRVTEGGDWPLRRAAAEALLRRIAMAERDGLKVRARPRGAIGLYETRKAGASRPWKTLVTDAAALVGSCDCPDFLKGSLGVCKHLVVAFADAHRRTTKRTREPVPATSRLAWNPVRPLTGAGDWLERVSWQPGAAPTPAPLDVRRFFARASDGAWQPRAQLVGDRDRRLELVRWIGETVRASLEDRAALPSDPALVPLARDDEERLTRTRGPDEGLVARFDRLTAGLRHQLYPYQREGVLRALGEGRLLLADDMGLGKTAQAIATAHALWAARRIKRGLVVVPAPLKFQWAREWSSFTSIPAKVVDGSPSERAACYRETQRGFLVVNYEQVVRDLELMRAWSPGLVVLDEAQRIKNWATRTAAAVKRLDPAFRLVLTGTPMENRLDELASILDWVDPHALEPRWRLSPWHGIAADGRRELVGARHLDTLRARLGGCLLRRRRQEVLTQLPARTDVRVPVELTAAQEEAHAELALPIRRLLSIAQRRPLTQPEFLVLMGLLTKQRIICNGLALHDFEETMPTLEGRAPTEKLLETLASPKLVELRALLTSLAVDQERKVVVFSQWRRMLRLADWATRDLFARAGLRAVFFTGEESQKRRVHNVVDFHDDPAARVFFATDAGGVGLNLQKAASVVVNLDLPWNPAVLEQRIGRIHRLGQASPIEVYNLVSETGIEARIAQVVAGKQAFFSGLFDGDSSEVRFDGAGSFLKRLEKLVDAPAMAPPPDDDSVDEEPPELAAEPQAPAEAVSEALPPAAPSTREPAAAAPISLPQLAGLVSTLRIEPAADGGLTIQAPREAAGALAALFGELARKLAQSAG